MKVIGWRIVKPKYAQVAFTGQGAAAAGGRWNVAGVPIVYTASSASLALLELLVNVSTQLLDQYFLIETGIAKGYTMEITDKELSGDWRLDLALTRKIGTDWAKNNESAGLVVPSAVLPIEKNLLLNPRHPDFSKLVIADPIQYSVDNRLQKGTVQKKTPHLRWVR